MKNAKQGMQDLQRTLQSAGKSFEDCDAAVAEYARGLGQMETTSRTARGEISELSSAFIELSRVYGQMSDQEKASPVGQALSKSLDELKTRTVDAKAELGNLNKQLETTSTESESTGGILDKLAGKFGLSGGEALKMGTALGAATTACKVAKDAFMANESTVDEWGRTVDSAKSLYNGFLHALNTGDISGFLSRIDQIVSAARAAYNELDRLGTMARIQAPKISAQQTENERFRLMLRTGRYIAPKDGRASAPGLTDGQVLTPQQMKVIEGQLTNGIKTVTTLVGNEVQQSGRAIEAVYNRWGAELGMSASEFKAGTSSMAEFDRRIAGYNLYKQFEAQHTTKTQVETGYLGGGTRTKWVRDNARNPYEQYKGWGVFRVDGDRYGELVSLMQQRDQKAASAYSMMGQAYQTMNRVEGITARSIMGRGGGGGGGSRGGGTTTTTPQAVAGSIDAQAKKVQELQKAWRAAADDDSRDKIKTQLEAAQAELDKMEGKVKAPEGSLKALNEELSKLQQEQQLVTTSDDWAAYDKKIAAVQKRIKELKGEMGEMVTGFAGLTNNSLGAWMSGQQSSLNNAEIGSEEYQALSANILDTKTLQNLLNTALKNDITISPDTLEDLWGRIIGGENIPDEEWQKLVETINAAIADLDIKPLKIDVESGAVTQEAKQVSNSWRDAARAVGAVGSALNQLENPAAKVAGIVGQAIANIALGFAQATAKSSNLGIFGWIAAIAGGLGTMISTISAIKSATAGSYAEGGIVPGNNYSDGLIANVSSGELILNRAQQDSVARQLTNGIGGNLELSGVVTGEQLRLVLNNNSRRRGRGEYVTTK